MKNLIMPDRDYKVVIYCATYNQRKFIADTLNGFISQKVTFPYCAVVIDDCSDDNQQEIILNYANKYPDIIKPIFLKFNHYKQGLNKNEYILPWIQRSEYVAHCEGDDYWIDTSKLQKQVEFMEIHKECALTYHSCKNLFSNPYSGIKDVFGESVQEEYTSIDILRGYPFQTATILYRSSIWLDSVTAQALSIMNYSSVLFLCASTHGRIMGINQQMSVYRRHNDGISNELHRGERELKLIYGWRRISDLFDGELARLIHSIRIQASLYNLAKKEPRIFIKVCWDELFSYPNVVMSVMKRLLKSCVSRLIKSIHI